MGRKPLIAGNWKMNETHVEAVGLVQKLVWALLDHKYDPERSECVVIPPYTSLRTIQILIESDRMPIELGAQDVSQHPDGAYTGDISASMLVKLGCKYVVVGHSERRQYHDETDELVNCKAKAALAADLAPIVCIGEGLPIREQGTHVEYTLNQLDKAVAGIPATDLDKLVIAYEPVWAIGTGKVATPADAQEVCGAIRGRLTELYGAQGGDDVRVLYGGSVKAGTAGGLMAQPDIDGALVGGASLDGDEFALITRFYDLPF